MAFNTKVINLLKTDPRFVDDEGELVIAAVQDSAWKIDHALVKLLLSDPEIKDKFFSEIDDAQFKVSEEDKKLNRRFYGLE